TPLAAYGAMLLCGFAISIKQTCLFEGVFFGLWMIWLIAKRSRNPLLTLRTTIAFGILGAFPIAMFGMWYAVNGHFAELWFALITSNIARPPIQTWAGFHNFGILLHATAIIMIAAVSALVMVKRYPQFEPYRPFMLGWLIAAAIGMASVGSFLDHHAIPFAVPLCSIAAVHYGESRAGTILGLTVGFSSMVLANPFDFETHRHSRDDYRAMQSIIASNRGNGTIFIFDGPPLLYAEPGVRSMTTLLFPSFLNSESEQGTTFIDQTVEVSRILAQRPSTVVMMMDNRWPLQQKDDAAVQAYVRTSCTMSLVTHRWHIRERVVPVITYVGCR
ncbi:MAG: hypothetical protein KGM49_12030, partial [Sphingomonadales bacterium]|nr:hypothetical protein [Sphingomonadales bacterium]